MANIYNFTDTWNSGVTTYSAIKCTVTDTSSAADSALINMLVGGTSYFRVQKDGEISTQHYFSARQEWAQGTDLDDTDIDGSNILTLGTDGNYFQISGTQQIDAIASITGAGPITLVFTSARTLTHDGTGFILPGGASITTASGDVGVFVHEGSGNWRCISYTDASAAATGTFITAVVDDTTPQLGGELDAQGNNIIDLGDVTFQTGASGGTLRTGTSAADKFILQAYDVDGAAYVDLIEADAGNDPVLQLIADYLRIEDATDTTKQIRFTLDGMSTGTTSIIDVNHTSARTMTWPDVDLTIVGTTTTQTLTNKTLTTPTLTLLSSSGAAPTAQGDIRQDTDDDAIVIGDGAATKKVAFNDETHGKYTVGVSGGGIKPTTTSGCATAAQAETTTNAINYDYLAFDASTEEHAYFWIPTPKSYNASTVTMRAVWTHPSTATNFGVVWGFSILSLADGDAIDTAVGTEVTVTDTGGTTEDFYTSPESGAITPSNTAAKQDWLYVEIARVAANGSDTLAVDAHLIGVELYYSTDASTDD